MDKNGKYAAGLILFVIIAYVAVANPVIQVGTYSWQWNPSTGPSGPTVTDPCTAYPGTTWDVASGSCKSGGTPGAAIYSGPANWNITSINGDTKGSLALTGTVYWLLDSSETFRGTPAQGVATAIPIAASDNGKLILVVRYLTNAVGFVDPDKTMKQNPDYMKASAPMYLRDIDTNGQLDQCYPLDVSGVSIKAGQAAASITINLISWAVDTAVTITNISSPTGMNTAGDYHATGFIANIAVTQQWMVQQINLRSNTTATTKFGTQFAAGTTYVVAFNMRGVGAQTNTVYGKNWLRSDFYNSNYDSALDQWAVFRAHNPTSGAVDISQVNYGMPFINERLSSTTWLGYDIWVHTTGDLVALSTHNLWLNVTCTNPAGATTIASLNIVFTG